LKTGSTVFRFVFSREAIAVAHELSWTVDPESWHWRLDLLEQLLACYQQALGHKLKNQLISIGALTRGLEVDLGSRLDGNARAALEHISTLARETGELSLQFAALGRMCRDLEPSVLVDLAEAVAEEATRVKVLYPQPRIEYHLQKQMPTVYAPRRPLHDALFQLLRLAADLVSRGTLDPAVNLTTETMPKGAVALHIAGTGRGLSEDELAILFQRLTSGAKAADQGLDLFLVRQAAALWGGGVRLYSEPGHGTTFTLLFAAADTR
jgi:two-component system, OmpR family, sensor histidine kinase SenX3